MNIDMNHELRDKLVAKLPSLEQALKEASIYAPRGEFKVRHSDIGEEGLQALYGIAKESGERGLMMQLTSLLNVIRDPKGSKIGNLKAFEAGVVAYLKQEAIDGWLYERDSAGEPMPSLVVEVKFEEADERHQRPARVRISYCRNRRGEFSEDSVSFDLGAVQKKTIPEALAAKGFYKETPEVKAVYEEHLERYLRFRDMHGKQFVCTGDSYDTDKYRRNPIRAVGHKVVNDEDLMERNRYRVRVKERLWEQVGEPDDAFSLVPMHPFVFVFNLRLHTQNWVHVASLEEYVYKPELKDKLVLPEEHRDLIEVLTEDMDILAEDVVDGKTGGTIILCKGAPGLGKTLTAQVWSEVIKRPLYSVHAGQLGVSAAEVEKTLLQILERGQRWGAAVLLDEADVYVAKRGSDMVQAAVVAAFLRVLEGYSGLLFLTTNRGDEVDDAIVSRCIAVVKYETPNERDCKRLWKILSKQLAEELDDDMVDALVGKFGCLPGRDIKGLVKLASKYARRKGREYDVETFRICAQFRGLI